MFVGHFAAAYAAKRIAPRIPLGTRFFTAQFLDLPLWPGDDARLGLGLWNMSLVALAMWLLVLLGWWTDGARR